MLLSNIIKVFSVDLVAKFFSIISFLFLPKFLNIVDYSYIQLYFFYISFAGFLHLGLVDGMYLRLAGGAHFDLDRDLIASQFRVFILSEVCILLIVMLFVCVRSENEDFIYLYILVIFSSLAVVGKAYVLCCLQLSGRIDMYIKCTRLDSFIYILGVFFGILFGIRSFLYYIFFDLIAKVVAFIVSVFSLGFISLKFKVDIGRVCGEIIDNVKSGFPLMVANILGLLSIGLLRFSIEKKYGIIEFGKFSLVFQIINIVMMLATSIAMIFYTDTRSFGREQQLERFDAIEKLFQYISPFILCLVVPFYLLIKVWLPRYAESLPILLVTFPICMLLSRQIVLIVNFLKVWRFERSIFVINSGVVLIVICLIFFLNFLNVGVVVYAYVMLFIVYVQTVSLEICLKFKSRDLGRIRTLYNSLFVLFYIVIVEYCVGNVFYLNFNEIKFL